MEHELKGVSYQDIYTAIKGYHSWQVSLRRWFHQHPELKFDEIQTSRKIKEELDELRIFNTTVGEVPTGIIAEIGNGNSPCIALRADMDALPIVENSGVEYSSVNEGCMHACGHDAHMAMLLGAARYLKENEESILGTIRLIFQPAEEGGGGARYMVEGGVISRPPAVERILALHVSPQLKTGSVSSRSGSILAAAVSFDISIQGKGGHAAMPHLSKDPIMAAVSLIQNINNYIARGTDFTSDKNTGLISVTSIITPNQAHNIIPSEVKLKGTVRALSNAYMDQLKQRIVDVASGTSTMFDMHIEVQFDTQSSYPVTSNDKEFSHWVERRVQSCTSIRFIPSPTMMCSEDFSFYSREVPACFIFLGVTPTDTHTVEDLHSNRFTLDENALAIGSALLTYLTISLIKCQIK